MTIGRPKGDMTIEQKFDDWVERTQGCWPWRGYITPQGYGRLNRSVNGKRQAVQAHRVVYEALVGPIPDGMSLDHLCQNKWCVRPDHMELVTTGENVRRASANREWKNRMARWLETGRWESDQARWQRGYKDALD